MPSPWALAGAADGGRRTGRGGRKFFPGHGGFKEPGNPILNRPSQGRADTTDDISLACLLVPTLPVWLWANGLASLDLSQSYEKGSFSQAFQIPTHTLSRGEEDRAKPPPEQPLRHISGSATELRQKAPVSMEASAHVPHARQAGVCLVGTLP